MSAGTPLSWMEEPLGAYHFWMVTLTADLRLRSKRLSSMMFWTEPLPWVVMSPTTIARRWSRIAPAKISEAEAESLEVSTTSGPSQTTFSSSSR